MTVTPTPGRPLHVLHVEDEAMSRMQVDAMLTAHGFQVTSANTLTDGIFQAQRHKVDAVILDLDTGDSEGLDTLATFKDRFPQIPVVVLTGKHPQAGIAALKLGAEDFLTKDDLKKNHLVNVLKYTCERNARHDSVRRRFGKDRANDFANPFTPIRLQLDIIRRRMAQHHETSPYLEAIKHNIDLLEQELLDTDPPDAPESVDKTADVHTRGQL